jgi:hypothetical protein
VEGEKVSQVRGDVYMSSGEAAGREMMNVERSEVRGINLCFFFEMTRNFVFFGVPFFGCSLLSATTG